MKNVLLIDSGVGGLTVLQQLQKQHVGVNFIYLADNKYFPYGTKRKRWLTNRLNTILTYFENKIDICIVACNTASTLIDGAVWQDKFAVINVIQPTCEYCKISNYHKVALFATNLTVQSGAYQRLLNKRGIAVDAYCCSPLVPLVEKQLSYKKSIHVVSKVLNKFQSNNYDAVILGCTHFPLLKDVLQQFTKDLPLVCCQEPTASVVTEVLIDNCAIGTTQLLQTKKDKKIAQMAKHLGIIYQSNDVITIR